MAFLDTVDGSELVAIKTVKGTYENKQQLTLNKCVTFY